MSESTRNICFFAAAGLFVSLAIVGGVRGYSPVPFWDMWDGYLGFYTKVSDGDWSAWWGQHNEHRIVLARTFFWLDLTLFGGQGWFLVGVNYSLLLLVCFLFWHIWKKIEPREQESWLGYFIITWLFWWIQKNNLEWGFQSQFILAQLLPLTGFYLLHRACSDGPNQSKSFALSLIVGVLSIGSMANGVLALPIMLVLAILLKMALRRVIIISGLMIFSVGLYFYKYKSPGGHGSLSQAIMENPIGLLHYVAAYVGGPFSFGSESTGLWTATLAGSFLIASSIFIAFRLLIKEPVQPFKSLQLALLAFILYVGGTALGTGGGRLIFGVEQALASRYMTPSLMAWGALFLVFYINSKKVKQWAKGNLWAPLSLLLILMLPQQLTALKSQKSKLYERNIAALALELGIKDQAQIAHVFPSAEWALDIARIPVQGNQSIFGTPPLLDLREKLSQTADQVNKPQQECIGHLDAVERAESDPRFLRVRGWLFHENRKTASELITLVDLNNRVAGYALTGHDRPDVAQAINKSARYFGFKGYVLESKQGNELYLHHGAMNCKLTIRVPTLRTE